MLENGESVQNLVSTGGVFLFCRPSYFAEGCAVDLIPERLYIGGRWTGVDFFC